MIVEKLGKRLAGIRGVKTAVLFGSYARGDMNEKSDVDLCIITEDKKTEKKVSEKILDWEKEFDKNIQVVFTDSDFTGQDRNFIENLLREGKILAGRMPAPPIEKLKLEPYVIIKYDMKKLTQPEKMKVNRILYGKKTTKEYNGKTYVSEKEGLVAKTKSEKIGRTTILATQNQAQEIIKTLREHKIPPKIIPAWIQKT